MIEGTEADPEPTVVEQPVLEAELVGPQSAPQADSRDRSIAPVPVLTPLGHPQQLVERDRLLDALERFPDSTPEGKLRQLILAPETSHWPLGRMVEQSGLEWPVFMQMISAYQEDVALLRIHESLPDLTQDMVIDARSTTNICDKCYGQKQLCLQRGDPDAEDPRDRRDVYVECPKCNATGKIRKPGDRHARALLFETVGFVGKNNGVNVNVQTNVMVDQKRQSQYVSLGQRLLSGKK